MFKNNRVATTHLAFDVNLIESTIPDVVVFKKHLMTRLLPIFSNTQGVESSIKDTVVCKRTGREEDMTSRMAMMRSCMMLNAACLTKKDPDFVNRKRHDEEARESFDDKTFNYDMLNHIVTFFPYEFPEEEIKHCARLLKKDDHFRQHRLEKLEQSFEISQQNPRNENQRQRVSGVAHAPS